MPIIKSAKKRVRVAKKATVRNVKTKRSLKSALKAFQGAMGSGGSKAGDARRKAQSALDKAAKKRIMHKNKVARKQRQLATAARAAGLKVSASAKKSAAKPATKKAATKKASPTKKSTVKKPATKKSQAKKTTKKSTTTGLRP